MCVCHVTVLAKILIESASIRVFCGHVLFLVLRFCLADKCFGEYEVIELAHIWQVYCYNVSFKLKR